MLSQKLQNIKEWVPIIVLAFAVFIFGTSEFIPVGLLPDIAKSLGKDEATTGLLLTVYAWVVATMSLPLTLATANVERKKLIISILVIFMLGNFCVAISKSFGTIVASRVIVAFCHCIFWSIVPPLAFRLSPEGKYSYGLAIIGGGAISSAILGIPICTAIGHRFGWHSSFHTIAAITLGIIAILYFSLPKILAIKTRKGAAFYRLRKNKSLIAAFVITIILVTGHFSVFTYIVPFLRNVSLFSENDVVVLLLCYGGVGAIGITFAAKFMDKYMRKIMIYGVVFVCMIMFSLKFLGTFKSSVTMLILFWSISLSTLFPTLQGWVLRLAKKDSDMASSIYSSVFNIGIGGGALVGGVFMNHFGILNQGFFGGLIILPVIVLMCIYARNSKKKKRL